MQNDSNFAIQPKKSGYHFPRVSERRSHTLTLLNYLVQLERVLGGYLTMCPAQLAPAFSQLLFGGGGGRNTSIKIRDNSYMVIWVKEGGLDRCYSNPVTGFRNNYNTSNSVLSDRFQPSCGITFSLISVTLTFLVLSTLSVLFLPFPSLPLTVCLASPCMWCWPSTIYPSAVVS